MTDRQSEYDALRARYAGDVARWDVAGAIANAQESSAAAVRSTGQALDAKVLATLQARAALVGIELTRMADGSFIVVKWAMTRALANVDEVEAFLSEAGK